MTVCVFYLSFVLNKINNNKTDIKMNELMMTYMDELVDISVMVSCLTKQGRVKNTVNSRPVRSLVGN